LINVKGIARDCAAYGSRVSSCHFNVDIICATSASGEAPVSLEEVLDDTTGVAAPSGCSDQL